MDHRYKINYQVPGLPDETRYLTLRCDLGNPNERAHLRFLVERLDGTLTQETDIPISLDGES